MSNNVVNWERAEDPLAPLSNNQKNVVLDLAQEIKEIGIFPRKAANENRSSSIREDGSDGASPRINNTRQFMTWYWDKEDEWYAKEDDVFRKYLQRLSEQKDECCGLLAQTETCLKHLKELNGEYLSVSNKTNSLHQVSEELLNDQMKLVGLGDSIKNILNHYKSLDRFTQSLDNASLNVHSSNLESALDQLNEHIQFHKGHPQFKESFSYLSRYEQCQRRLLAMMRDSVTSGLSLAAQHASANSATHYAKFQVARHNLRPIIALMENRVSHSTVYEVMLNECHEKYVDERQSLIGSSVVKTMEGLVAANTTAGGVVDLCSLMRAACAFLIHVSLDEHKLYHQFFTVQTEVFTKYLEGLCTSLYDTTRPLVIHMKHLESLAELCSILRLEMIQEQVNNNRDALEPFGNVAEQLLQDVQERLVFRAHMYLRSDVAEYKPSQGDLAYPEKLHMMQSIAQSLYEQEMSSLSRCESRASLASIGSLASQDAHRNPPPSSSPADLHAMWYPPVRRTLLCLSRLYRCVERPTFQGISQEALTLCMESIKSAAIQISANKSPLDGEMFQIKHLLILREQIAPFQVDFTVKEMALDFTKMKSAAAQLLNKRTRLFSLSSNNALLEFLLEGSPEVREQWLDSRKDVDRGLKASCENFIRSATNHLMPDFLSTLETAENWENKETLKCQPWASPGSLSNLIKNAMKCIKSRLPELQSTMQLYLANRDTEFILYRPIRNNVVGSFTRLHQFLSSSNYTEEDLAQIGCPTAEQAYVLISSASLLQQQAVVQQQQRKISSEQQQRSERKISSDLERKVSFEGSVHHGNETHMPPPPALKSSEADEPSPLTPKSNEALEPPPLTPKEIDVHLQQHSCETPKVTEGPEDDGLK